MDSGVRLQRYIIQEWGDIYNVPILKNGILADGCRRILLSVARIRSRWRVGKWRPGYLAIVWINQSDFLAGLTLLVLTVMLIKMGRPARYTMLPMIFVMITSSWAAVLKLIDWYKEENWLLVSIDVVVLITSVLVILEAASVISRFRREDSQRS